MRLLLFCTGNGVLRSLKIVHGNHEVFHGHEVHRLIFHSNRNLHCHNCWVVGFLMHCCFVCVIIGRQYFRNCEHRPVIWIRFVPILCQCTLGVFYLNYFEYIYFIRYEIFFEGKVIDIYIYTGRTCPLRPL